MLCAPLDWQYAELPSSASDAVLCSVLVRTSKQIEKEKKKKGASTTEDLVKLYRHLIESASEQITVKNIAQRLRLKTIGMIDTPAAAVDFMNIELVLVVTVL